MAASARQIGSEVTVVERAEVPLQHVLGREIGGLYAEIHRDHGVELLAGAGVEAFVGEARVERVELDDGRAIECDLVVVGVGVTPRIELAEAAGLAVENGILVDEHLETSVPGIFAAGDVANVAHPFYGRRLRVEHWANALHQPEVAARAMLGKPATWDRLPYFFSDQYDVGMEYAGFASGEDEVVIRGDRDARELIAFWLREDRVVAGMNVNVWDVTDDIQALIRTGAAGRPRTARRPRAPLLGAIAERGLPSRRAGRAGRRGVPRRRRARRRRRSSATARRRRSRRSAAVVLDALDLEPHGATRSSSATTARGRSR